MQLTKLVRPTDEPKEELTWKILKKKIKNEQVYCVHD